MTDISLLGLYIYHFGIFWSNLEPGFVDEPRKHNDIAKSGLETMRSLQRNTVIFEISLPHTLSQRISRTLTWNTLVYIWVSCRSPAFKNRPCILCDTHRTFLDVFYTKLQYACYLPCPSFRAVNFRLLTEWQATPRNMAAMTPAVEAIISSGRELVNSQPLKWPNKLTASSLRSNLRQFGSVHPSSNEVDHVKEWYRWQLIDDVLIVV